MANLTTDRKASPNLSYMNLPYFGPFGLAANQVIYAGCMYALGTDGRPVNPGSTAVVVAGVATEHYSNTAGAPYYKSGATDGVKINLFSGVFMMDVHATHPPTAADLWGPAYASDNHTISRLASDGSYAGTIVLVEGSTVYVYFAPFGNPRSLAGITAAALTENGGAIGGTNNGDLPSLTPTYAALTGANSGTANGALEAEGTLATAGGNTYSDAAVNAIIAKMENNIAELAAQIVALAADSASNRAAIREVATTVNTVIGDLA